ncbi:MAG: type II toxin-antitoxin system PemK/MazF family toxin [Chloroflexota bacterium]|nr:type II toxin-antitoxin system PemK/MazF family toxin [Chloroflexota bacterium]
MPEPMVGEVWTILFDSVVGREQGGLRPGLILSNDVYNAIPHELRIVVPITGTDRGVAAHLPIHPPEGGLSKPSVIMCEQVTAQSLLRFRRKRGEVSQDMLDQVQAMVGMFIDRR